MSFIYRLIDLLDHVYGPDTALQVLEDTDFSKVGDILRVHFESMLAYQQHEDGIYDAWEESWGLCEQYYEEIQAQIEEEIDLAFSYRN